MFNRDLTLGCFLFLTSVSIPYSASVNYQEDTANFPNPERGFYITEKVTTADFVNARAKGMTMARKYYELRAFVDTDEISQAFLDGITKDAESARQTGAKIIPRFIYSRGGTSLNPVLPRILLHIDKLAPVLKANSDVIAFMEAGLIGMYGEWHYAQGQPSADKMHTNPAARKAVLTKLLGVMPDRMIALRYNRDKREIFGDIPLESDSAFTPKLATRTGAHNDCFASSTNDIGTYDGAQSIEWQKTYLNKDNRFVVQGGENCGGVTYTSCQIAMTDLKRMHWDVLNSTFNVDAISKWESQGCLGTMKKNLGYRIKLNSAQFQDAVRPGYPFSGTLNLTNVGWGKIYNARGCELVFRNTATKSKFKVQLESDPRRWFLTDSTAIVNVSALIPASVPEGSYHVYLNLPDTAARLNSNPAFSIRLANTGVWEDSTGYNSLQHSLTVSKTASAIHKAHALQGAGHFSFSVYKKNQTFSFLLQSREQGIVGLEIFSLEGRLLSSQKTFFEPNEKREFSWTRPSNSAYLAKIKQGEKYQEWHTVF